MGTHVYRESISQFKYSCVDACLELYANDTNCEGFHYIEL